MDTNENPRARETHPKKGLLPAPWNSRFALAIRVVRGSSSAQMQLRKTANPAIVSGRTARDPVSPGKTKQEAMKPNPSTKRPWPFIPFVLLACTWPLAAQEKGLLPKSPVSISAFESQSRSIQSMPLPERLARGMVPTRGLCSTLPGSGGNDQLISGNGKMQIRVSGDPVSDRISFHSEKLLVPWKRPFEAPKIAYELPAVRKLILAGKYADALALSLDAATKDGMPPGTRNHRTIAAFTMEIDQPRNGTIKNYLRTLDFESGEITVHWEDNKGSWERRSFVSRPDNVIVQRLSAPQGASLTTRISLRNNIGSRYGQPGYGNNFYRMHQPYSYLGYDPSVIVAIKKYQTAVDAIAFDHRFTVHDLIVEGHFDPFTGNIGFAGVVRVVLDGGTASIEDGALVVEGARSLMLLTRIERYEDFQKSDTDKLIGELGTITPDYQKLLARNRAIQSEMIDRVSLNFDTPPQERAMSGEELMADQKTHLGYNRTLLSKLFDMSRYWIMSAYGDFPAIAGQTNININLQGAPGEMANLPESMNAWYNWVEGLLPDSRTNAKNIFGTRGALFSIHPDQQQGVLCHYSFGSPHHYWISAGGWLYNPFWDHYLVTGDKEFLKNRIVPGLKELALFYEDFLTETDEKGNYIFVPSYSPENWPANTNQTPAVVNATMDIMVCREVLTRLIEASEILGVESENIPKWKGMLAKMPNYLIDRDGALKEWAWPTLEERQDHRHISHEYGVWPGDEIDPDRTPELAKAAWLANRKRAPENGAGHGLSHRALAAARLKDSYLVNFELKQFLEQGYFGNVLTSSHNPYTGFMPDEQGSVLSLMMEMLVYSRPGVIEFLPALPETLEKGSITGVLARTFAKVDNLSWDLESKTIDATITSLRDQDISLIVRQGIRSITAPEGVLDRPPEIGSDRCGLHLPKDKPVTLHIEIGDRKPSDWISAVGLKARSSGRTVR
jgi:hypothetical protein